MPSHRATHIARLVFSLLVVLAAALLCFITYRGDQALRAQHAAFEASAVEVTGRVLGTNCNPKSRQVWYTYAVNGKAYQGRQVCGIPCSDIQKDAPIRVFYAQSSPQLSQCGSLAPRVPSDTPVYLMAIVASGILIGLICFVIRPPRLVKLPAAARAEVDEALRSHTVTSANPQWAFDPATATLVREENYVEIQGRTVPLDRQYSSHRIYRTPYGEYFLFICSTGQVFLTHLSERRARNALRSDPDLFRQEFPAG